jgi:RNA polymerase sigma-70 factor (ECF subfamily)
MPPPVPLDDADLMRHVQAGDHARFEELVHRYRPALLRVARSRLARADWAEDAAQETLLAAFKSRHTFDPQRGFRTWLWTILLNQCRRLEARRTRRPRVTCEADRTGEEPSPQPAADAAPLPLEQLLARERTELLDALLARLPATQADALRLRFFAGLKFQEIADAVGCSLLTAKNRVRAGLHALAGRLDADLSHAACHLESTPPATSPGETP